MKADPNRMTWQDFEHVASFFPEEPRTAAALNRTLFDLGQLLRIAESKITQALRSCDPGRILLAFNYLLANVEKIRHPGAYLDRILAA